MAVQVYAGNTIALGTSRCVIRTSVGNIYAIVVGSSSDKELFVFKSTNGGTTWVSQDGTHSPSLGTFGSTNPIAASIDSTGVIHIAYGFASDNKVHHITFATSTDLFGGDEVAASPTNTGIGEVAIAIDSNDIPHVAYSFATVSSNDWGYANRIGGSWTAATQVANLNGFGGIDILVDNNNLPEVAVLLTDVSLTAYLGNANNATSFTAQNLATFSSFTPASATICMDSSNNTWVAYSDVSSHIVLFEHISGNAWTTWSNTTNLVTGFQPSLVANGSDIYVFFQDGSSSGNIKYSKYNGTWGTTTPIESGTNAHPRSKWAFLNNNGSSSQIDFLFDNVSNVYWDNLIISPPPRVYAVGSRGQQPVNAMGVTLI